MDARDNTISDKEWRRIADKADVNVAKASKEEFERRTEHVWNMQKNRKNN
jgi:hypothetical protein